MSVTDAQYSAWLRKSGQQRCALFELTFAGRDISGSPIVSAQYVARVSNMPYVTGPSDSPANTIWDDCVVGIPTFTRSMGEQLMGRSSQSFGDLILSNENNVRTSWLSMVWDGYRVRQWLGSPDWAIGDFRLVLDGIIDDVFDKGGNQIGFHIKDKSVLLARPVMTTLIGGSGPYADKIQPLAYGNPFNATPRIYDAVNLIYQVSAASNSASPTELVNRIDDVRESGASLHLSGLTIAAVDAGSDTLTASAPHGFALNTRVKLSGSPPAPLATGTSYWVVSAGLTSVDFRLSATRGGSAINITATTTGAIIDGYNYDFNPATGRIQLSAQTLGQITCDFVGLTIGGTVNDDGVAGGTTPHTEGAIATAVLTSSLTNTPLTSADLDATSIAAFESLCAQSVGEYLVDPINFDAFLDRLVLSVGGYWTFSRDGLLQMGRLDYPTGMETPVLYFVEDDFAERTLMLKTRIVPRAQVKVLDNKNQTVQDPASIAGVVTTTNRARYSTAGQEHLGISSDPPIAGESLADHRRASFPTVAETNLVDDTLGGYGQDEANRRARLFRFPNAIWSGTTHHLVYGLKIGDAIHVTHPKFTGIGFVISIIERANAQSTIEFFTQLTDVYPTADLEPAR